MSNELTGYDLSRSWFDFCFENPEKVSPNHTAIFFFAIEHCNRMGWATKFGFPTQMAMNAIGIKKHQTYIKYFNELVEWGFLLLVQKSQNQWSANIISIGLGCTKNGKALGKAISKHAAKQTEKQLAGNGQSTGQSNSSINKPLTYNKEPYNEEQDFSIEQCLVIALKDERWVGANKTNENELKAFNAILEKRGVYSKLPIDYKTHFANWKDGGKLEVIMPEIKGHVVKQAI